MPKQPRQVLLQQAVPPAFEVQPLARDPERAGGFVDPAVMILQREPDHLSTFELVAAMTRTLT